ncbi:MAG TPA: transglutaminase-like domain-containing protein, partial [Blastocatellia bacterium]|nr:transglutaminase-like domain-containing protein [Blastocatellia bacterium]
MKTLTIILLILLMCGAAAAQQTTRSPRDQELYALARTDLKAFAQQVSKDATSELGRAQAIVRWLAENFEWKATDYQKRTVQQIIDRSGGNCYELALVALAAMKELNIRLRQVHEVNIHTNTPRRGETAHAMVKEKGNTYSVFGRHHNDHVWLELYDSVSNEWFPADPSAGLVGLEEWMKGRVWFGKRATLNPITEDMIVPFAIFAADDSGKFTVNRTQHYLVDQFDRLYGGRLYALPEWKQWTEMLDLLDDKVAGAFAGNTNLHDYEPKIDSLAEIYEHIRASLASPASRPGPKPSIFILNADEFWLNLHSFLYVLGRAENKARDAFRSAVASAPADQEKGLAELTKDEQTIWREAVTAYSKGLSQKDAVFDEPLTAVAKALADAGDAASLSGANLDPAIASLLQRAAPLYRKAWWPSHHAANQNWKSEIQKLVDQHGAPILSFITTAYMMEWPSGGFPVHISAYANWAGAYSTAGNLLVLS